MKISNKKVLEKKASSLRQELGFNNSEPIALKGLLLKHEIVSLFRPMSDDFSGMALKVIGDRETHRFIMVNSNKTVGHQNFTICHELYHLYIQSHFESQICQVGLFNKKDVEEYNADFFAACFLLPEEGLLSNIPDHEIIGSQVSVATVLKIENLYGCSRKALLIRLKQLNLITESFYNLYQSNIKQTAILYGYAPYLYEKSPDDSVVGNYGALAHQLYDQEIISESHYYSLMSELGVPIETIELQIDEEIN